jgi:hypothetical protein
MKTYRAALISIATAMTLIVSGCSAGEKVDEALVAKCELLRANLAKLTYSPEFTKVEDPGETFDYLSLSVSGYFAGNVGVKSRAAARELVVNKHPYLADYLSTATGNEYSLDNAVRLAMLEEAIKGTGFTLSLTDAQKQNTKGDYTDPSHDLLEKELIVITGKSSLPGRPVLYGTSRKFMDYFGINSMDELPDLKEIASAENSIGDASE